MEPATHLVFTAAGGGGHQYRLELELRGELNPGSCKVASVGPRQVAVVLMKAAAGPHWDRLLAAGGKPPAHVKVDWNKWKDEEDEAADEKGAALLSLSCS